MIPEGAPANMEGIQDFEAILSRYSPVPYRTAFRRLQNSADAEDAVQDALLAAYKHRDQFAGRSRISTWLTRIVINAAGMQLRRRPRYEAASLDEDKGLGEMRLADLFADDRPNPEQALGTDEARRMVREALTRLSPKLRGAVQLHEIDGLPLCQSARILGVTTNTMKSRVRRGRVALASLIRNTLVNSGSSKADVICKI